MELVNTVIVRWFYVHTALGTFWMDLVGLLRFYQSALEGLVNTAYLGMLVQRRMAAEKEVQAAKHNREAAVEAQLEWIATQGGGSRFAVKPAVRPVQATSPVKGTVGGRFMSLGEVPENFVPPHVSPRRQSVRKG